MRFENEEKVNKISSPTQLHKAPVNQDVATRFYQVTVVFFPRLILPRGVNENKEIFDEFI